MVNIGDYVRREKDARGLTLEQLHRVTGIKPSHLSRMINDPPKSPDVDTVRKFAQAFCVEPAEIWKQISGEAGVPAVSPSLRLATQIEQYLSNLRPEQRPAAERMLIDQARHISELLMPTV